MAWSDSYIHSNGTDQFYVKPKPMTASPGWSSNTILGVANLAFSREYVFAGLEDGIDYAVFQRLGGQPADTDTFIDTLKAPTAVQQTTPTALRAAFGLATANIDTQLSAIAGNATNAAAQTVGLIANLGFVLTDTEEIKIEMQKVPRSASPVVGGEAVQVQHEKITATSSELNEFQRVL